MEWRFLFPPHGGPRSRNRFSILLMGVRDPERWVTVSRVQAAGQHGVWCNLPPSVRSAQSRSLKVDMGFSGVLPPQTSWGWREDLGGLPGHFPAQEARGVASSCPGPQACSGFQMFRKAAGRMWGSRHLLEAPSSEPFLPG